MEANVCRTVAIMLSGLPLVRIITTIARIDPLSGREIDLRRGEAVQSNLGHIGRNTDDFKNGAFHIGSAEFNVLAEQRNAGPSTTHAQSLH